MIKILILIIFTGVSFSSFSQHSIGDSRTRVKKKTQKYILKIKADPIVKETDSTLVFFFHPPKFKETDFIYHFDENNKCDYELSIGCDSCINEFLHKALATKMYRWKQVNSKKYVSQYSNHLMLSLLNVDGRSAMQVKRIHLTRKELANYLSQTN